MRQGLRLLGREALVRMSASGAVALAASVQASGAPASAASGPPGGEAPVRCTASPQGGPAPSQRLSAEHEKALDRILKTHSPQALDARSAAVIQQALCDAGVPGGSALNLALSRRGFSAKQLEQLAPRASSASSQVTAAAPGASAPAGLPPGRRVPPRE